MKLVYYSVTGKTKMLVDKLKDVYPYEVLSLEDTNPFIPQSEPFILIVPSYEEETIQDIFEDFLETEENLQYCLGLIGTGNRNFGELYLVTSKRLNQMYSLPILTDLEFYGTPVDIERIVRITKTIEGES